MKLGDTVITPEGKEGKVSNFADVRYFPHGRLVYVDFEGSDPYWKIYLESDLKSKMKK